MAREAPGADSREPSPRPALDEALLNAIRRAESELDECSRELSLSAIRLCEHELAAARLRSQVRYASSGRARARTERELRAQERRARAEIARRSLLEAARTDAAEHLIRLRESPGGGFASGSIGGPAEGH